MSLGRTELAQATTAAGHMSAEVGSPALDTDADADSDESRDVLHSGNSVDIVEQLQKSGDISSAFALESSIVKAFHRMIMLTLKG